MRKIAMLLLIALMSAAIAVAQNQTAPSSNTQKPAATTPALAAGLPPPPDATQAEPVLPAGTLLHVTLATTLTDATNKEGDPFTGTLADPVEVNGKVVLPEWSEVDGHVAYVKPAGRIYGKAQMRIVLDKIVTPDNVVFPLAASLGSGAAADCGGGKKGAGKAKADAEGKITGCGKSKKDAAKAAAIAGAFGAAGGATVGLLTRGGCDYYGCYPSQGPGVGTDVMYGAGIGAGTALIYELFKHEKHIVLLEGTKLTFAINRAATPTEVTTASSQTK